MSRFFPLFLAFAAGCGGAAPLPPPPPAPPPVAWPAPVAAPAPPHVTPDAPFRERVPEAGPPVRFVAPKIEAFALKNGVKVLLVERHELPIVSVRVVVKAGAGDTAGARPGTMSFLGAMLEQGTKARTALQISDEYDAIGASHFAWFDWDSGGASVKALSGKLDLALDLLGDVVLHPSLPDAEIERLRARRLASIQQEKNSPGSMVGNAVAASVYGRAHPYGHSLIAEEDDAKKLTRAELVTMYERLFSPALAAIVVSGDVTRKELEAKLEKAFGAWKVRPAARGHVPAIPPKGKADSSRLVIVDRPGAPQSQVVLAQVGVPVQAPDRDAIVVMNALLGGMFSSRINLNLREKNAYTYGARSSFAMRRGAGPFTAGGAIFAEKTAAAVHELFKEIESIRADEISEEELVGAKENIKLAMPGRFETVTEVTGALADLVVYDLPLDEYATRPARIDAVTAADVKRVAAAHLTPRAMKVIVVGDRATQEPALEVLHLGAPDVRDAYGNPAPTATPALKQ